MESESVRVGRHGQSFTIETSSIFNVHVLVVDDDATSLAVVSAMLRTLRYGGTISFTSIFYIYIYIYICMP